MKELLISLDNRRKEPLYEQIYSFIKREIQSGKIPAGEKLPSSRNLARQLAVSRSTVDLAYDQLSSEGYLESIPCKGYYAGDISALYQLDSFSQAAEPVREASKPQYLCDFDVNGIADEGFPVNAWRKLSKEVLAGAEPSLFCLGDPQGEWSLRETVASYLHHARGVSCGPDQIVVGAGNDYLLMLLSVLLGREQPIAMENPTYKSAYRCFRSLGHPVRAVPLDDAGMSPEKLEECGARIAYVMPSHQFPMGMVMPIRRRMQLLAWAADQDGRYLIEDDYDSEFRYKGKPIPALQGYDRMGKVIYTGTFSKSIAPAIRMSYLVLPEPVLSMYLERCGFINSTVSKVDQLILQKFIEDGYYERHLNKTRALYRSRHDTLLAELKELGADIHISGENAGVHLLLHFRDGRSEEELISKAAEKGVKVYGLSEYYVDGKEHNGETVILLGYANMNEERIREAAKLLAEAWR